MAYNFSRINLKCDKFAFLVGYYVTLRYHIFLKQYKTAIYTIRRAKCDESVSFDVSIFDNILLKWYIDCIFYFLW